MTDSEDRVRTRRGKGKAGKLEKERDEEKKAGEREKSSSLEMMKENWTEALNNKRAEKSWGERGCSEMRKVRWI